jgi:STE24 endopeptidase
MHSAAFTWAFVAALLASYLVRIWLAWRQVRHVAAHRERVPAAFVGTVSPEAHRKAADYTLAKVRFGGIADAFAAALLLGWTLLGGLDALNGALRDAIQPRWGDLPYQLALLAAFFVIGALLEIPLASTARRSACGSPTD